MKKYLLTLTIFAAHTLLTAQDGAAPPKPKGGNFGRCMEIARQYELKPMAKPDWAEQPGKPLFRAAWFSDLHITSPESEALVKSAFNTARDVIKPDFAFITGDNSGIFHDLKDNRICSKGEKCHQWLKEFIEEELVVPYCIVPGDNWPWGFESVFGSFHYSFDLHGFHFLFTATDRQSNTEGCSVFEKDTWEWMKQDLAKNTDKPTFFIMHETLWPPSFLDAPKTEVLLNANPQCLATLNGHLHLDLDLTHGPLRQLIAPAIGRSHRPAFKHLRFYKELVVIESYEWDSDSKTFTQADKWQKIDIPENLQKGLAKQGKGFAPTNRTELNPYPKERDNTLKDRAEELSNNLFNFLVTFGLGQILGN